MNVYRAVNEDDINNLIKHDYICSSLWDSYLKSKERNKQIRKNVCIYYNLCFNGNRKYALDTVIGHISGKKIDARISPWVSVSNNFNLVASEYSIPQAGKYNYSRNRKSIAIIDIPDDFRIDDKDKLLGMRESKEISLVLDLRDGNLSKFFDCNAIMAEKYNEDMPGYNVLTEINDYKTNVNGFSNFAKSVSEMLVFAGINKKFIKAILSPSVVDIVYSCGITDIDFIIEHNKEIESLINCLNTFYIGNNLVDILYDNYYNIIGNNIEDKYKNLLEEKKEELNFIVKLINEKYNKEFEVSRLLDSRVVVKSYNDLTNLDDSLKNDLVLIERDSHLYRYMYENKGYYNDTNKSIIKQEKVIKLIKKR